jgi:hypothetical protein
MLPNRNGIQTSQVTIAVGDGLTTLVSAPGAGRRIVVTRVQATVLTTAAQPVILQGATAVLALRLGVSTPVGTTVENVMQNVGIKLLANEAFRYVPGAAGYSLFIVTEYYTEEV